jgi:hypothetical protein
VRQKVKDHSVGQYKANNQNRQKVGQEIQNRQMSKRNRTKKGAVEPKYQELFARKYTK